MTARWLMNGVRTHTNCELLSSLSRDSSGMEDTFLASQQRVFRSQRLHNISHAGHFFFTIYLFRKSLCSIVYELPACIHGFKKCTYSRSPRNKLSVSIPRRFSTVTGDTMGFFLSILFLAWTFLHAIHSDPTVSTSTSSTHPLAIHHLVSNKVANISHATVMLINETLAVMQNVPSPSASHLGHRVCEFAWIVFVFISLSHFIISLFLHIRWRSVCTTARCHVYNMCRQFEFLLSNARVFFCSNAGDNDYIMAVVQRENNSTRREFAVRCKCRTEIKSLPLLLEIHGYTVRQAIQAIATYVFPVKVEKSHSNDRTHGAASCDVWNVHKLLVFSEGI